MIRSLLPIAAILFLVPVAAHSQNQQQVQRQKVKIDVKTQFVEKRELSPIKAGVIAAINNSIWGQVVEIDEHYSLWIKDPVHQKIGQNQDSIEVALRLELRTPAMFRDGKLLNYSAIRIRYARKDTVTELAWYMGEYLQKLNLLDTVLKWSEGSSAISTAPTLGLAINMVRSYLKDFISSITKQNLFEGMMVYGHAMPTITAMVRAASSKK